MAQGPQTPFLPEWAQQSSGQSNQDLEMMAILGRYGAPSRVLQEQLARAQQLRNTPYEKGVMRGPIYVKPSGWQHANTFTRNILGDYGVNKAQEGQRTNAEEIYQQLLNLSAERRRRAELTRNKPVITAAVDQGGEQGDPTEEIAEDR